MTSKERDMIDYRQVVLVIDNHESVSRLVRELTAEWVTKRFSRYDKVRLAHAVEVGNLIKEEVLSWYPQLVADTNQFTGQLLAMLASQVDWIGVGSFYLGDYIDEH
jgi:hypothetical protein